MELNPNVDMLESVMDSYRPDRLKALLLWFNAEQQLPGTGSEKLNALLDEVQELEIEETYSLLQSLKTEEMVRFSLVNEFGKAFAEKACFNLLVLCVTRYLLQLP